MVCLATIELTIGDAITIDGVEYWVEVPLHLLYYSGGN